MIVKKINLISFRKFHNKKVNFTNKINIILGKNAVGKTTILESIYFLTITKSPRTSDTTDLIPIDDENAVCSGTFELNNLEYNVIASYNNGQKRFLVNNKKIDRLSDYVGTLNSIYYQPNEIVSFLSTPQNRRNGFNSVFCQISSEYMQCLKVYNQALKERKFALKEAKIKKNRQNYILIETCNDKLIYSGLKLISFRRQFLKLINDKLVLIHQNMKGDEHLTLNYIDNVTEETFPVTLKNNLEKDIQFETTNYGPHRDDFIFMINDHEITKFCSQGQQKSVLLSYKICLMEIFKDLKKDYPILLLDDAFSELDKNRQNSLFKLINNKAQVIISTTSLKDIDDDIVLNANIIQIQKGEDDNERN